MPPTPPPRQGLSTRHFAWIFGGLLLLLTIFQMTRQQPQRFEPPPSSTSAEIGYDAPAPPAEPPMRQQELATTPDAGRPNETDTAPDLSDLGSATQETPAAAATDPVYTYVEQMPQPPGGMEGLMRYLAKNVKVPAEALRNQVEGKVFVRFVVRPDGQLTDFEVVKGLGSGLDEEAVRVLRRMPRWTPGKQNGRTVSVAYTVPVTILIK